MKLQDFIIANSFKKLGRDKFLFDNILLSVKHREDGIYEVIFSIPYPRYSFSSCFDYREFGAEC